MSLDDCDSDFVALLNADSRYAEAIVGHKNKFTRADYENFPDEIAELTTSSASKEKLENWINRSSKISNFGEVVALGNSLSKNIKNALTLQLQNHSGDLYNKLATLMGHNINDAASMLAFKNYIKDFELLEEIPLITKGDSFMRADILLVKITPDGIEDAIIIENKLSQGTVFTERQKEGFGAIINGQVSMTTKYSTTKIGKDVAIPVSNNKIFKFNDAGTDDISNVVGSKITKVK